MRTFDKYLSMTILAFLVACSDDNSSSTNVDDLSSESLEASSSSLGSDSSSSDESSSSGAMPESSSSLVCSSSAVKSSSSIVAVPCKTETKDNCKYGTLIDERDGQSYRTVEIGRQVWMAENLNYAYLQPTATLDSSSWCYDNDSANCETYGRLYLWSAAVDSAALFSKEGFGCGYEPDSPSSCFNLKNAPIRGVCPAGWHMPSPDEWLELFLKPDYSSIPLRSRNGWEDGLAGTDDYGFDVLPSGFGDFADYSKVEFYLKGKATDFCTRDNVYMTLEYALGESFGEGVWAVLPALPVRCVKDTVLGLDVSHGTMTDYRDGQVYKTVTIGGQTWMAENLNYAYLQPTDEFDSSSWCYDNNPDNCKEYGRLYLWSAVMDSVALFSDDGKDCGCLHIEGVHGAMVSEACLNLSSIRGICPEKWHVPSKKELDELSTKLNTYARLIKSTDGWQDEGNGSNALGMNILPSGIYDIVEKGSFKYVHYGAYIWSTTAIRPNEMMNTPVYAMKLLANSPQIAVDYMSVGNAYSVRCIKDE